MPLALSTRRPRSASGSRPSRFSCSLALSARHLAHALGTVYEAPTFSQWVPAFSRAVPLALSTRRPRSASGFPAFSLSRLALASLSESAPQTCPQRDQRTLRCSCSQKMSVALMLPTKSTGWAFPHTTLVLWQVLPRTPFKMSFWDSNGNKARENETTKQKRGAHQQIDQGFEENVFSHQVVHCLQSVERSAQSRPASSICAFGAACTLNTCYQRLNVNI